MASDSVPNGSRAVQVSAATQEDVIKDVLTICQGIQGRMLRRRGDDGSEFEFPPAAATALSNGMQANILMLCELGWLYKCDRHPLRLAVAWVHVTWGQHAAEGRRAGAAAAAIHPNQHASWRISRVHETPMSMHAPLPEWSHNPPKVASDERLFRMAAPHACRSIISTPGRNDTG